MYEPGSPLPLLYGRGQGDTGRRSAAAWLAARVWRREGKGAAPGGTGVAPPTYCTQHANFEPSIYARPGRCGFRLRLATS
jgi:hypothetical protein